MRLGLAVTALIAVMLLGLVATVDANGRVRTWLATGTVTKVNGDTFYFLGKDDVVYHIQAGGAEFVWPAATKDRFLAVVDRVRVYGTVAGSRLIDAIRVRVLERAGAAPAAVGRGPDKIVKVVVRKDPSKPSVVLAPSAKPVQLPPPNWRGQGLVTGIDYGSRRFQIQTSTGGYTINTTHARVSEAGRRSGFGWMNVGDVVRIAGNLSGLNQVNAQTIDLLRRSSDAEGALPVKPASFVGVIQSIDYSSMSFRIQGETAPVTVSADPETVVQQHMLRMAFMDLKPGMKVKVSGYGSLGSGYAAQHIQIIGVAP